MSYPAGSVCNRDSLFDAPEDDGRRRSTRARRSPSACGRGHSTRSSASSTCSAPRAPLRRLVESDEPMSLVLYGPPGTGKTTLAHVISLATKRQFVQLSALDSGVKEVRAVITAAKRELTYAGRRTVLFIDEVHRFSKTQQDCLLSRGRGPDRQPDRGHDREPVLLRGQPAALAAASSSRSSRSSDDDIRAVLHRALTSERGLDGAVTLTDGGRGTPRPHRRRRRPQGADRAGVRRRGGDGRGHRRARPRHAGDGGRPGRGPLRPPGRPALRRRQRADQVHPRAATSTPRCTTWPAWSRRGRTRASSPDGWSSPPARTSAWPTRRRC